MIDKTAQYYRQVLSISGTLAAISFEYNISKLPVPSLRTLALTLSGLTIPVVRKPKMKAPKPKPAEIKPLTSPFRSGKYSQAHMKGVQ